MLTLEDLLDPKTGHALHVPEGPLAKGLRASIERAAKTQIPHGKRGAVLAVADRDGLRGGVVMKVDARGNWLLSADAERAWSGSISGCVVLVGSY